MGVSPNSNELRSAMYLGIAKCWNISQFLPTGKNDGSAGRICTKNPVASIKNKAKCERFICLYG